jgi:hypothetical protein
MKIFAFLFFLLSLNSFAQQNGTIHLRQGESTTFQSANGQFLTVSCQQVYNPNPYPPYGGDLSAYLRMEDDRLLYYATSQGVGTCKVTDSRSCSSCHCDFYLKTRNGGFPNGTGCQSDQYQTIQNLRKAIQWGACN